MILEIGAVVAVGVAAYEYVTNAKFKAAVKKDIATATADVAVLQVKAKNGVAIVEADFDTVKATVAKVLAKL